jgi:hypothetical protein
MGVEAVGGIVVDETVFGLEQGFVWNQAGVVFQEDQARFGGREFGGDFLVRHVAGPEAFVHDDRKIGRHGDAGVERIDRFVGVEEFGERLVSGDFGDGEVGLDFGRPSHLRNLQIHPTDRPSQRAKEENPNTQTTEARGGGRGRIARSLDR